MRRIVFAVMITATMLSWAQTSDKPIVRTRAGQVQGIIQEGTQAFLGIPYATVERFMPPQPVKSWTGIKVCDHWGPQAMQGGRNSTNENEMSEQCCVLNVWTTPNERLRKGDTYVAPKLKPVMVWLCQERRRSGERQSSFKHSRFLGSFNMRSAISSFGQCGHA